MKRVLQNERGMALALAIVALVVVGALVAGAFFAGTQEQRVGENSRRVLTSFGVAEAGILEVVRTWRDSTGVFNSLASYPSNAPPSTRTWAPAGSPGSTGAYSGTLYKLNDQIFLIDMTGTDSAPGLSSQQVAWLQRRGGGASQRLGMLTTIRTLQMDIKASLTSGRGDALSGIAVIDGYDHTPTGWTTCGPLDSAKAGIRTDTSMSITTGGSSQVTGMPAVMHDPNVTDSTFSKYGDVNYSQLAARAQVTLPGQNFSNSIGPVVTGGTCDKTVVTNWGDGTNPGQPCANYFPIVHITGNATINGVQGQGILLVDGSLSVQGGFQWFGITIVRGTLSTAGGGATDAHFWGTTMVQDSVVVGSNTLTGHANILYSKCAILKALDATGIAAMMRSRSWVQLF